MPTTVEFGRRQVATEIRNRLDDFLAESDDARTLTVTLSDRVPESMVQRVREEAADSRQAEAEKAGQVSLTEREKANIDFSKPGVNVPKMRSIKGIAQAEGVEDWLQFADTDLTVDENRGVLERASREERGRSGLGRSQEKDQLQRAGDAKRQRKQQAEQAKGPALGGDADAIDFLREERRFEDNLFDVSLRGDGPSGSDFGRLQEAHNDRSERAQTIDERRSAEVTRDPLQWASAPNQYDFPGIDTVQPAELHEQRSEEAQRQDEREQAPIADSREVWAQDMDHLDWPGVDTASGGGDELGFVDGRVEDVLDGGGGV